MFHLGWFTNYMPPAWNTPWAGNAGREWQNGGFHLDLCRALERGFFDFVLLEDSSFVSSTFGGTFDLELGEMVRAPKHDPMPLAAVIAAQTRNLGVIATANTSFYPPYLLARLMSTLDHISAGRIGWNIVTGAPNQALANFGGPAGPASVGLTHDERYDLADEFVDVVEGLWSSWEPDAVRIDHAAGQYIDPGKVHTIDHRGTWFSSRGPLNTVPGPQHHPVICQAGGSSRGRAFAARHAEVIIALPKGVEEMRRYRQDVRRLMAEQGRDPDDCKVMYIVSPILGDTRAQAQERRRSAYADTETRIRKRLALMSGGDFDWSRYDLDRPLPDLPDEGQSIAATFRRLSEGKTLRQALIDDQTEALELVGTVCDVADLLEEAMAATGGDGVVFYSGSGQITRRYVDEIVDGLVPELQRRGLTRTGYDQDTLRAGLRQF